MLFLRRPKTVSADVIALLEHRLVPTLAEALAVHFRTVAIVEELYDRTCVYVHCEASIEQYALEAKRIKLTVATKTAPYFQQYSILECLVMRVDIWDEKIALSDEWFHRNDVIAWAKGELTVSDFIACGTAYW